MSGLFGTGGRQSLPSFDLSALAGYYQAKAQVRAGNTTVARTPQQTSQAVSFAPWDQKSTDATPISRLRDALGATSFVDVRDSAFEKPGLDQEQKKLFAIYKGLSRLQALAAHANDKTTPDAELTGLNRRFEGGLGEIKSYLANTSFNDLTMLFGERVSKTDSSLKVARPPTKYSGPSLVSGAATNVIPGLAGSEVFTVSALKGGATTSVTMDLSAVTRGLTLSNVITYMNAQMEAAGLSTRFTTTVFDGKTASDTKRYGLGVQTVATERVSFAAAVTAPAIYVAGVSGTGAKQSGQLLKLTDQGSSVVSNFDAKIEPKTGTADARASATDADGNVFVVGSVTGDLGGGLVQGAQDVYLRKYDAAGQLIWSRLLGSSERATGFTVATDASGNVAIAGKVSDRLTSTAIGGGDDSFVTKYDADGREIFTRQISPGVDDQANALAFGADGALYVAGQSKAAIGSGITHAGGIDAYLMKLTSTGSLDYARQFGGSGDDRATSIAIDGNGDVILGTVESGDAKVRKLLSGDGTSGAVWEVSLGALGQGQLSSVAVDGSSVYVGGTTDNAALTAGGQASVVAAHSGGTDGFVMKIADSGTTAAASFVSYVGTAGSDGVAGLAVNNGAVYVSGSTNGALNGGAAPLASNGYVAKLDANGARVWSYQYESKQGSAAARAIAVDGQGGSVLDQLGLPRGAIRFDETRLITAASSVRAGDHFYIKVNGGASFKVSVAAGDTMRSLVTRMNSVMLLKGEAELTRSGGDGVRIAAKEGNVIELIRGSDGFDALAGLGLQAGKLDNTQNSTPVGAKAKDINVFALGLSGDASISEKLRAGTLSYQLSAAMETIKSAYLALTRPAAKGANQQAISAYRR